MKSRILKLAGVKSEQEFYSKFPTEESFMAKHGKELLKAKGGNVLESMGGIGGLANTAGQVVQGVQSLESEIDKRKRLEQWSDVSDVVRQAASFQPEEQRRQYLRPEDISNTGEEFFPIYGVGTNVLAKNGKCMPKKKKAVNGQWMKGTGMYDFASEGGGDALSNLMSGIQGENAGGDIGGSIGGAIGSIWGPAGKMVGKVGGQVIGSILDTNPKKIKKAQEEIDRNLGMVSMAGDYRSFRNQNSGFMEDGGNVNSEGDIRTHWGGELETISHNPYLPGKGETIEFQGQSHDESDSKGRSGIGVTYGNTPVEVETNETAMKTEDGLVIFGDLNISRESAALLEDPKAKGRKFKNYVADLSRKENTLNRKLGTSVEKIGELPMIDRFDKLTFNSMKANITGSDMNLKDIAQKKIKAAALQQSINDTAEENGWNAKELAQGKIRKARRGDLLKRALTGDEVPVPTVGTMEPAPETLPLQFSIRGINPGSIDYNPIKPGYNEDFWNSPENYQKNWVPYVNEAFSDKDKANQLLSRIENYSGQDAADVKAAIAKGKTLEEKINIARRLGTDQKIGPYHNMLKDLIPGQDPAPRTVPEFTIDDSKEFDLSGDQLEILDSENPKRKGKFPLVDVINGLVPRFRGSDVEGLDPRQLAGEMYSLSTNYQEPVWAQKIQPELSVPYDISYQDLMNENQADYRSAQRLSGYNPAALAMLNSQKYQANQKVMGEQFRANQALKDKVYTENRDRVYQSKLANMGVLDQQQVRQSQAKSNTKAAHLAALNSISDKYMKNQLENRTLATYENLYNYRYDDRFRARNRNPLATFDTELKDSTPDELEMYEQARSTRRTRSDRSKEKDSRNGSIVSSIKRL